MIYSNLTSLIEKIASGKSSLSMTKGSTTTTSVGYYFLNFSISNDNVTFSSPPLTLIAYDSRSYSCSSLTMSCRKVSVKIRKKKFKHETFFDSKNGILISNSLRKFWVTSCNNVLACTLLERVKITLPRCQSLLGGGKKIWLNISLNPWTLTQGYIGNFLM